MTKHEFEKLVIKYTDCIFRIAIHSGLSREDAEDLTQESFMKLWYCKHDFPTEEDAKFWLIRVTVNSRKNLLRHLKKKEMVPFDNLFEGQSSEQKDFLYLYQAIGLLPLKYRQVLYLYYFEEYSVREIAEILQRSETAVQTQLMRARKRLKKELGDQS